MATPSRRTIVDILIISTISIVSSVFLILLFNLFPPKNYETHVPHGTNEILERNYDGPIYVAIAKTLYNPEQLKKLNFNDLPPTYFANHFPVYPLIIRLGSFITHDYFRSMILTNWISSILFTITFYLFLKNRKINHPLLLSILSLFIPPRWLAVRSVGGNEGFFMLFLLLAFIFWERKRYLIVSLLSVLAVLCRPPGILLFPTFIILSIYEKVQLKKLWSLLLIPISLASLFVFYSYNFGDLMAYFHTGTGTNVNLQLIPFAAVMGYIGPVPEGFLYLYLVYSAGLYLLWKQKEKSLTIFVTTYFLTTFFLLVDDVWRYLIPVSPYLLIIAYRDVLTKRIFILFFVFLLFGIYLYTFSLLPFRIFNYDSYVRLRN